jgi:trehalose synthase
MEPIVGSERIAAARVALRTTREHLNGRTVWHVSDNQVRGGVAELLHGTLPYLRGEGVTTRWATLDAPPEFRAFTKSLYYQLCGVAPTLHNMDLCHGRTLYEKVSWANAAQLIAAMDRGSLVVIHDHQAAGLIPHLRNAGYTVLWRAHIGTGPATHWVEHGWGFLRRYVAAAHACISSYPGALPVDLSNGNMYFIHPSINPLSAKNLPLAPIIDPAYLLSRTGIINNDTKGDLSANSFTRRLLRHPAKIIRKGNPLSARAPLITQVGRWDRVKDIPGVMKSFTEHVHPRFGAHLALAGPMTLGDVQAEQVFEECRGIWTKLPPQQQKRVHLIQVPINNPIEHAFIINAIQCHSKVVIQKSVSEGFGLTVSEAA